MKKQSIALALALGLGVAGMAEAADTTPPVITSTLTPAPNAAGWNNTNVTLSWSVTDPQSGIRSKSGCGTVTQSTDTAGQTYTCTAKNRAGLTSTVSVTIRRDTVLPTATITTPVNLASYTVGQTVNASFACSDALSTIATCAGSVANSAAIDTATTGTKYFSVTATDKAGNAKTTTVQHCMDTDYSVFTLLPPFNSLTAQLMVNGKLVKDDATSAGYTLEYTALTDSTGSTNSSYQTIATTPVVDKTNFWTNFTAMFGGTLTPGIGLFGFQTPTNAKESMEWNGAAGDAAGHKNFKWYEAYGVPVTPIDDKGTFNPYPMVRVTAKDAMGKQIASSSSVLPVSTEMNCQVCHASNSGTAAQPTGGWIADKTGEQQWRLNALRKHDERFAGNTVFQAAMAKKFSPWTKLEDSARGGKPIFCDTCHNSNALAYWGFGGEASVSQITTAMHKAHAGAYLPGATTPLDSDPTREACYSCHPGKNTQCLRGAMGNPTDPLTGKHTMECQSCHGGMKVVGTGKMGTLVNGTITNLTDRRPWFDMPTCQTCHQNGQRFTTALTVDASNNFAYRASTDTRFATNANTPNLLPGLSMYRFSVDHGQLQCAACHNSTHAEFTPKTVQNSANDDARAIEAQGYVAAIRECTTCHASTPQTGTGGPHGMHAIGAWWADKHHDYLPNGTAPCTACHGADYRGSPLSQVKAMRSYQMKDTTAKKTYNPGDAVGCYDCHNGPNPG
jgi:hypothetical protein